MASTLDQAANLPRKVWITRTEPGAARTAARVAALGFEPLTAPLLTIHPTGAAVELEPFEVLALTSTQAIAHLGVEVPRHVSVFTVGEATARAARAAGFSDVVSADGDVEALAELILKARPLAVVHPAATRTAGDLVGRLMQAGLPARRVLVYRTEPCKALPVEAATALAAGWIAAILLHSPRAAEVAAALLDHVGVQPAGLLALGLSPACVGPLADRGFPVRAAAAPTEGGLMRLLAAAMATI